MKNQIKSAMDSSQADYTEIRIERATSWGNLDPT